MENTAHNWIRFLDEYVSDLRSDVAHLDTYGDHGDIVDELRMAYTHLMIAYGYVRAEIFEKDY